MRRYCQSLLVLAANRLFLRFAAHVQVVRSAAMLEKIYFRRGLATFTIALGAEKIW